MTQRRALLRREVPVAFRHDPAGFTLKDEEPAGNLCKLGNCLRRGRTGADERHALAGQVVLVFPARRMELGAAKAVEARPIRIAGHVEETDRADEDLARVECSVAETQSIGVGGLVPHGLVDGDAHAEVAPEVELVDNALEILLQLRLASMGA